MNLSGKTGTNHTVESFKVEGHKVQNHISSDFNLLPRLLTFDFQILKLKK
ncbi:hypothetical protein SAMN05444484_11084 [Flavobacterium chilense]|uniref:Uncharacterized protein n=1 Tax=Flavobacterium chilense TaxID=946677 RepID=A0A1M7LUX8_9FLAO|nr:hypothetical protein SAMN05444484_11084 [Flavobacterium chilense]